MPTATIELMPIVTLSALMPPQQTPQAVGQWIRESARAMQKTAGRPNGVIGDK